MLTSCLFESSETGLDSWADSKGIPSTYKVHTITVSDLKATSVNAFLDTLPKSADLRPVLGRTANLKHDLAIDWGVRTDSSFMANMAKADSVGAFLSFTWLKDFYESKHYPSDSLSVEEDLDVVLNWKISTSSKKSFADSLADVNDSMWYASLAEWEDAASADTAFTISLSKLDSAVTIDLPSALVEDLKTLKKYARVELKLSVPSAEHAFRFYGEDTNYPPFLSLWYKNENQDSTRYLNRIPNRMANMVVSEEDCKECLLLHGGVFDSLVVEIPPEPILKALSEFYGDDFPVSADEMFDVRQNVMLAELTMARDDSQGSSELGLPIQVVVGSYIDSAKVSVRRMETYRLNDELIHEDGHPNLIFHDGDSLSIQLTYGVRDFLNRAQDGRGLKFMMRMSYLGYPFLQEKDTTYRDYINDEGDTLNLFFPYYDYARYDFSSVMDSPMTLKIWVASKRNKEEDK